MRKFPVLVVAGLGLLATLPALAAGTRLSVTCTTRDLPPGAHVWVEVVPEYYQTTTPAAASLGEENSPPEQATGEFVWAFDVPAGGEVAPLAHDFTFPVELDRTSRDHVGSIRLKARFKIDLPSQQQRGAYGEVIEATFGMPVLPGNAPLSRCLRLREGSSKLLAETAPDCRDATFASLRRGEHRIRVKGSSGQ